MRIFPGEGAALKQLYAACCRLGPALVALWLAYPQLERLPGWLLQVIPLVVILGAYRPRILLVAIPIVIALVVLNRKIV